jgi:hypothetical protein
VKFIFKLTNSEKKKSFVSEERKKRYALGVMLEIYGRQAGER